MRTIRKRGWTIVFSENYPEDKTVTDEDLIEYERLADEILKNGKKIRFRD